MMLQERSSKRTSKRVDCENSMNEIAIDNSIFLSLSSPSTNPFVYRTRELRIEMRNMFMEHSGNCVALCLRSILRIQSQSSVFRCSLWELCLLRFVSLKFMLSNNEILKDPSGGYPNGKACEIHQECHQDGCLPLHHLTRWLRLN